MAGSDNGSSISNNVIRAKPSEQALVDELAAIVDEEDVFLLEVGDPRLRVAEQAAVCERQYLLYPHWEQKNPFPPTFELHVSLLQLM